METITLANKIFRVVRTDKAIWLHGPRGACYFLREFLGDDTGRRAVVSWKSGAELRDQYGNTVRVLSLGDTLEVAEPRKIGA